MGDMKKHCLVCDSYTSSIGYAWAEGNPCPVCGASKDDSLALERIKTIKNAYKAKNADNELINQNEKLLKENTQLKIELNIAYKDLYELILSAEEHSEKLSEFRDRVESIRDRFKDSQ